MTQLAPPQRSTRKRKNRKRNIVQTEPVASAQPVSVPSGKQPEHGSTRSEGKLTMTQLTPPQLSKPKRKNRKKKLPVVGTQGSAPEQAFQSPEPRKDTNMRPLQRKEHHTVPLASGTQQQQTKQQQQPQLQGHQQQWPDRQQIQHQKKKSHAQAPKPKVELTPLPDKRSLKTTQELPSTGKRIQEPEKETSSDKQSGCNVPNMTPDGIVSGSVNLQGAHEDNSGVTSFAKSAPISLPVKKKRNRKEPSNSTLLWEAILAPSRKSETEVATELKVKVNVDVSKEKGDDSVPMVVSLTEAAMKPLDILDSVPMVVSLTEAAMKPLDMLDTVPMAVSLSEATMEPHEMLESITRAEKPQDPSDREENIDDYRSELVTTLAMLITALRAALDLIIWLASPGILPA